MAKDVCQCPNCNYSLGDMVEEYDNQEILPKEKKIFICPSCNHKSTFENYIAYSTIAFILCLAIVVMFQFYCLFSQNKCSSYNSYLYLAHFIFLGLIALLSYSCKWFPRLKSYKS